MNRDGRRFVDETTEYAVLSGVVKDQLNGECFAVLDDETRLHAPRGPYPAPSWDAETLARLADQGRVFRADSLEALAEAAGIRAGALATTVAAYNAGCAAGADSAFFKAADLLRPIARPPFWAVRLRPSIVCLTSTGLRIDTDARVLDRDDRPVAGLYAAGETTGGVLGERYIGGGNSIANAIVFGRIAGASAASRGGHNAARFD